MRGVRFLFVLAVLGTQGGVVAAEREAQPEAPELRQRAEDLARAASQRFTEILDGGRQQVAQAAAPQPSGDKRTREPAAALAPVLDWLERASKSYDDTVLVQLRQKDGWATIVQRSGEAPAPLPAAPAAQTAQPELRGWSGLAEIMRYWLARANSAYRNEIVTPLRGPEAGEAAPADAVAQRPAAPASATGSAPAVTPATTETPRKLKADDDVKRAAEAGDAQRRAVEASAKRAAQEVDANKRRAEAKAAEARRAEEEKRLAAAAEEKRKAQAEARARLLEEAETRRKAEAKRAVEAAEAKRKADAEAKRLAEAAEAKRKAEEAKRKAEAEAKRLAEQADAKRKAAEAKRQAEEADAAERRAVAEAEAEAKRKAEIEAEATRRSAAAARAKDAARSASAGTVAAPAPAAPALAVPLPPASKGSGQGFTAVGKENSALAITPQSPERKPGPKAPVGPAKAASTAREEAAIAEASQPSSVKAKSRPKSASFALSKRKRYAYSGSAKQHHAYRHKRGKRAKLHSRPYHLRSAAVVYIGHRCDCRCPRTYVKRGRASGHASWRPHPGAHRYRVALPKHHYRGRVSHRHHRHYIR